jgi:hypothetical protein
LYWQRSISWHFPCPPLPQESFKAQTRHIPMSYDLRAKNKLGA